MNKPYKNISDTNTAFGNLFGSCVNGGTITNYEKLYNQSVNLYDELDELRDDSFTLLIKDENDKKGRKEMVDAIGDLLVFLYGVPHFLGLEYVEMKSNSTLKSVLSEIQKPEFYEIVYDDIKNLIDGIVENVREKKSIHDIMKEVKELDTYLMSFCDLYHVDVVSLIQKITDSNMSKLCLNEQDTKDTLHFYESKGVEVYSKDSPLRQADGKPYHVVYSSKEQEVAGKVYRAHKFLKCINWYEPDLSDI